MHYAMTLRRLVPQPRRELGRVRRRGRRGHGPGVGPLHGRLAARLRAQRDPAAPGARDQRPTTTARERLPAAPRPGEPTRIEPRDGVTRPARPIALPGEHASRQYAAEVLRREQLSDAPGPADAGRRRGSPASPAPASPTSGSGWSCPGSSRAATTRCARWAGGELVLDVVVHDVGPGHRVGGARLRRRHASRSPSPRARSRCRTAPRWLLLVGDLTALPAMARIVEHRGADVAGPGLGRGARRPARLPARRRRRHLAGAARATGSQRAGRRGRGHRLARGRRATSGWRGSPRRCGRSAST